MTKEDMVQVLRSVGVNENTVTAMINAFDMGADYEREQCAKICDEWATGMSSEPEMLEMAAQIRNRGNV